MKNDRKEHRTQTEQFRLDGYLALPGFLDEQEIAELREHVFRFIATVVPTMPREEVFYEDKNDPTSLKQLQRMFQFDSYFYDLMMDSRFTELASTLLAHDVRGINLQYFNKPPGIGRATPAHQDGHYFMIEPSEAVTMWLALEDVDEENGCIRYVRGSHLRGLRPHGRTNTLGFSQGLLDFGTADDTQNEVALPARSGDLLVHHSLTIHRADGNRSINRTRQALGFIYFSSDAIESDEKHQRHVKLMEELKRSGQV